MSKNVILENALDTHLKPLKVDDDTLPIEVSKDDIRISQSLDLDGDLNAKGNLNVQGNSINFENDASITASSTEGRLSCEVAEFEFINTLGQCKAFIIALGGNPLISFLDTVVNRWAIGVTSNVFTIGTGVDLSVPKLQLDGSNLEITGDIETTILKLREIANSESDEAGHAQLWVKNDTPNNLYFTNDAGNDVQITNGASLAGGSSGLNPIIASMIFG